MKVYELIHELSNFPQFANVVFLQDNVVNAVRSVHSVSYEAIQPDVVCGEVLVQKSEPVDPSTEYAAVLFPEPEF